jgi:hypothetical protein
MRSIKEDEDEMIPSFEAFKKSIKDMDKEDYCIGG